MATNDQKPKTPAKPSESRRPALEKINEGIGTGNVKRSVYDGICKGTVTNTMPAPPNKNGSGNKGK